MITARVRGVKGATGKSALSQSGSEFVLMYDAYAVNENGTRANPETPGYFGTLFSKVVDVAPLMMFDLPRGDIDFEEDTNGSNVFRFTVRYSGQAPEEDEEPNEIPRVKWSVDTTGATAKITQSRYGTTRYAVSGRTAPNHYGAIGVHGTEVDGIEIVVPTLKLTATAVHKQSQEVVWDGTIDAFTRSMASMTGSVNNAPFFGYEEGELLFLGATFDFIRGKDTQIVYSFLASSNVTGVTAGLITGIAKKGHEYLWHAFEMVEDGSAGNALATWPVFAYVEKVYPGKNFADLKIGTANP
jgi:hypothetical protein